ncbi:unnamed protein product [Effrenium voratum]|nr:unnamed protein product [Effrenium voratum]
MAVRLGDDLPEEVSKEDIQHMLDKADAARHGVESLNEPALKRMHLQFERKVRVNRELRIKHGDDPDKFLKSEVDLDEEIKKFTLVATHPELYGALLRLETLPLLVGMLNHVNTDIAVDVFEVLSELTDPEVLGEAEEAEAFVKALFDAQLCQMSVDVLMRIDESTSDEDFKAVTNGLSMIENLADLMPLETCRQFVNIQTFLPWLIKRVRAPNMDYNKVYASEILGIVLQNLAEAREAVVKLEGVDKLLRGIAAYRKRDPADSEEAEYVQNMFDCLCSLMLLKSNQLAFGNLQGSDKSPKVVARRESFAPKYRRRRVEAAALGSTLYPSIRQRLELMIRMMKDRVFAATLALKLSAHAVRHCPENCQIFVEKLGLKVRELEGLHGLGEGGNCVGSVFFWNGERFGGSGRGGGWGERGNCLGNG